MSHWVTLLKYTCSLRHQVPLPVFLTALVTQHSIYIESLPWLLHQVDGILLDLSFTPSFWRRYSAWQIRLFRRMSLLSQQAAVAFQTGNLASGQDGRRDQEHVENRLWLHQEDVLCSWGESRQTAEQGEGGAGGGLPRGQEELGL